METAIIGAVAITLGAAIGFGGAWLTGVQNSRDRKMELLHVSRERRSDRVEQLYKDVCEQVRGMRAANAEAERRNGGHGLHYQWVHEKEDWVDVEPYFGPLEDVLGSIRLIGSADMVHAAQRYVAAEYALLDTPTDTDEFRSQSEKSQEYLEQLLSATRAEMNIP